MPTPSRPRSLADLLACFRGCFTAPTFATFTALVTGFLAQPGQHTVTAQYLPSSLVERTREEILAVQAAWAEAAA